jgi:hypothetical protein
MLLPVDGSYFAEWATWVVESCDLALRPPDRLRIFGARFRGQTAILSTGD